MVGAMKRLDAPVDVASLVAFRILFGLCMVAAVLRFFVHGWIHEYFLAPTHFFHYWGFGWVKPWSGHGMYVHYAVMGAAALLVTLGVFYRAAIVTFFVLFTYAHLIDKTNYLNHYYLVSCLALVMAFLPLDRRAGLERAPSWCLWLVRFQVGCVYVFGGVAKLQTDWLVHAQPLTIWLGANTEFPILGRWFHEKWFAYAFSWAGAAFDLTIVFWLLWRRSRPFAFAALVVFHLVTARLFQLGMFPFIMIGAALIFLDPSWPRPLLARLGRLGALRGARGAKVARGLPRWGKPLLAAWVTWQILMPLRHWLYPGNHLWTEEGFRFSWNVMLMEKNGAIEMTTVDPTTRARSVVDPADYLTRYQTKMMSTQPDMILELAHVVADDLGHRGLARPEVYVESWVALNGRRPQLLVDPRVDLAKARDGLAPKRWLLPLGAAPPEL
jgi:vitamin K-dependent gamma-carboxylase